MIDHFPTFATLVQKAFQSIVKEGKLSELSEKELRRRIAALEE